MSPPVMDEAFFDAVVSEIFGDERVGELVIGTMLIYVMEVLLIPMIVVIVITKL